MNERSRVDLMGMQVDPFREAELVEHLFAKQDESTPGATVLTANLDILRIFATDDRAREVYQQSDLCVADGMPLVWAARLAGTPIPERVAGSTLSQHLIEGCWRRGWSLYFLGGAPGTAERAAAALAKRYDGIEITADSGARFSNPPTKGELDPVVEVLQARAPGVVLVGLGSPKQEAVIAALRQRGCRAVMVGVGGTFGFLAGDVPRAPRLLQSLGLEWLHRLAQEPHRLAERYLCHDLPFFFTLMGHAMRARLQR